jgi:hypothetical protein
MKFYYLKAIEKGNSVAMNNLGEYYEYKEKNYEQMKIFYLKAISLGNTGAMFRLSLYYENTEKNYELAKKYYLLLLNIDEIGFNYYFRYYIIQNIILTRLIINDICELFNVENDLVKNVLNLDKINIFTQYIFDYLKVEDDYELLPDNMNIYFLYIGKILNKYKYKKDEKSKINDIKKIREIIENFINKTVTNNYISKLIIKKYIKEIYEVNK